MIWCSMMYRWHCLLHQFGFHESDPVSSAIHPFSQHESIKWSFGIALFETWAAAVSVESYLYRYLSNLLSIYYCKTSIATSCPYNECELASIIMRQGRQRSLNYRNKRVRLFRKRQPVCYLLSDWWIFVWEILCSRTWCRILTVGPVGHWVAGKPFHI